MSSSPPMDQMPTVLIHSGHLVTNMNIVWHEPPVLQPQMDGSRQRPISFPYGPDSALDTNFHTDSASSFLLKLPGFGEGQDFYGNSKRFSDPTTGAAAFYNCDDSGSITRSSLKQTKRFQVKPFTRESLERLERKTKHLVRDYGFQPRRKLSVEDGSRLPTKYEPFPKELYGRPLDEIDNFIYEETFCVVSKRFQKNYIHRFTATSSFFIFSPWSNYRKICIYLSTNQFFDYMVMATILLNCVFLAKTETIEEAE